MDYWSFERLDIFFVPIRELMLNFFVFRKTFFVPKREKSASRRTFSVRVRKLFECRKTVSRHMATAEAVGVPELLYRSLDNQMWQTTTSVQWKISAKA